MIKLSRRVVAGAAAVLALGTGSAALATTSASAAEKPTLRIFSIPRCAAWQLGAWVTAGRPAGHMGTTYYHVEVRNFSRMTCSLYGWPDVVATDGTGAQLGVPAARDTDFRARHVIIWPGGTAQATLGYDGDQVTAACGPADAAFLDVTVPHTSHALRTYFSQPVCTDTTADLTIGTIRPGA